MKCTDSRMTSTCRRLSSWPLWCSIIVQTSLRCTSQPLIVVASRCMPKNNITFALARGFDLNMFKLCSIQAPKCCILWHDLLRPTEATVGLGQKCPSLWHPTNAQLWIKTRSIWPRSPWDWDPGSRMEGQGAKSHGDSIQRLQQFIDSKVLPKWFYSASVLSSPESNVFLDVASQNSSTVHNSFWKCIYLVWRGPITPWNTLSR